MCIGHHPTEPQSQGDFFQRFTKNCANRMGFYWAILEVFDFIKNKNDITDCLLFGITLLYNVTYQIQACIGLKIPRPTFVTNKCFRSKSQPNKPS